MNDHTQTDHELISSYLDGEATAEEVALVNSDPSLRTLADQHQRLKNMLSAPVTPLPDQEVDQLISAALAESTTSNKITDLEAAKARRGFHATRLATIAAAMLLIVGVVGVLLALNNFGSDDSTATSVSLLADTSENTVSPSDATEAMPADDSVSEADAWSADDSMSEPDYLPADDSMSEPDYLPEPDAMPEADAMSEQDDKSADGSVASFDATSATSATTSASAESSVASDAAEPGYRMVDLGLATDYATLDDLIKGATNLWQESVDNSSTAITRSSATTQATTTSSNTPQITTQILNDVPCWADILNHIGQPDNIGQLDNAANNRRLSVATTNIDDTPITIALVEISTTTALLLSASPPDCTVIQNATING
ncbi:MAG: hypothetical protein KTU85_11005 [Acidimicrobiia bacterium]|nr:hypothetical protein [Acidimicrobiia bacterium]MCY4456931.1 hypothetical protein [Acidimicrobiaceae bacterium]